MRCCFCIQGFFSQQLYTICIYSSSIPLNIVIGIYKLDEILVCMYTRQGDCSSITIISSLVSYSLHLTSIQSFRLASQTWLTNLSASYFQYHTMKAIHARLVESCLSHETNQNTDIKAEVHQKLGFSLGQINHDVTNMNEMRI